MDILLSTPIGFPGHAHSTARIWQRYLPVSTNVRMTTGYITSDAVIELKKIAELNKNFKLELLIGMHYFDHFTEIQFDAVTELSKFLEKTKRGRVYLSSRVKYHGKMYSFIADGKCIAGAIGSSNLGSFIGTSHDLYETDCCFDEDKECNLIDNKITKVITELGEPFAQFSRKKFKFDKTNELLLGQYGVEKVETSELTHIFQKQTSTKFNLPLKTEARSNLNVYFGKGRKTSRGMVQPRPWYEVEIIVPSSIRSNPKYPAGTNFYVVTSDGWKFSCSTNGEKQKNFRSSSDLKILGRWIKGTMEMDGVLKIGNPITEATLNAFHKHSLRLTKTAIKGIWTLEFV